MNRKRGLHLLRLGMATIAVTGASQVVSARETPSAIDRIAMYGSGKTVCLVEVEHDRAKLGTNPDFAEFAARVTSVYEMIGGRWKLVHRHADPITTARPAESMLGK